VISRYRLSQCPEIRWYCVHCLPGTTQFTATFTRSCTMGQHAVRSTNNAKQRSLSQRRSLTDAASKVPNRWPVGDRATLRHSTHANDITTWALNILPVNADDGGSSGAGEICGWSAVLFPCRCCPVNRSVRIVRLWSASVHGVGSKIYVLSP